MSRLNDLIGATIALGNRLQAAADEDDHRLVRDHILAAASSVTAIQTQLNTALVLSRRQTAQAPAHDVDTLDDAGAAVAADAQAFPRCEVCKGDSYTDCRCLKVTT